MNVLPPALPLSDTQRRALAAMNERNISAVRDEGRCVRVEEPGRNLNWAPTWIWLQNVRQTEEAAERVLAILDV